MKANFTQSCRVWFEGTWLSLMELIGEILGPCWTRKFASLSMEIRLRWFKMFWKDENKTINFVVYLWVLVLKSSWRKLRNKIEVWCCYWCCHLTFCSLVCQYLELQKSKWGYSCSVRNLTRRFTTFILSQEINHLVLRCTEPRN